jgi:peroxiredoxin
MVSRETPICEFDWKAPNFSLEGVDGKIYNLESVRGKNATVVMFICNHCPYVKAILDRLVRDMRELQKIGIGIVAIMSNDPSDYPEDNFENMRIVSEKNGFTFPYIIDPTQQTARTYKAVCTPDFFGFDKDLGLKYRGRLDSSRKEPGPKDARRELFEAMHEVARSGKGPAYQIPSIGCSIKWIGENS